MDVILKQDFPSLGYVGDLVKVKGGYARNFLIPRGIALEASARNKKDLEHRMQAVNARKAKLKKESEDRAKQLAEVSLDFTLKLGEKGKSYGSITAKDVESALAAKGIEIDKRLIKLSEPIRKSGEYKAPLKLHSEVTAYVTINVVVQAAKAATENADSKDQKPKRRRKSKSEEEGSEQTPATEE